MSEFLGPMPGSPHESLEPPTATWIFGFAIGFISPFWSQAKPRLSTEAVPVMLVMRWARGALGGLEPGTSSEKPRGKSETFIWTFRAARESAIPARAARDTKSSGFRPYGPVETRFPGFARHYVFQLKMLTRRFRGGGPSPEPASPGSAPEFSKFRALPGPISGDLF